MNNKSIIILLSLSSSIILSLITIHNYPVFNFDGVRYLLTANTYLNHGLLASFSAEDHWPFYSILIAIVHRTFHLSFLHAGYVVNTLLDAATVIAFILLAERLGLPLRFLWVAAITILIFRSFNALRADIIRDHGYLFSMLLALFSLISFRDTGKLRFIIFWVFCSMLATAFRLEGGIFLLLIPWIIWFFHEQPLSTRAYGFIMGNCLTIILLITLALSHHLTLGRLPDLVIHSKAILFGTTGVFQQLLDSLRHHVLGELAQADALSFAIGGMIFVYGKMLITTITVAYIICIFYAFIYRSKLTMKANADMILIAYIILNIILTSLFYSYHLFIVDRYVLPLTLIALCYAPFGLLIMAKKSQLQFSHLSFHSLLFYIVMLFLGMQTIGDLHAFGPTHHYVTDAAKWIKSNTKPTDIIYTNQSRLPFMITTRSFYGWKNAKEPWQNQTAYAVLEQEQKQEIPKVLQATSLTQLQTFSDKNKTKQITIFKLK